MPDMERMLALHQQTVARQQKRDAAITKTTEYYENAGVKLGIDIYEPNADEFPGLRPGILLFFGGGFMVGCKDAFGPQAEELAKHGYVAFSADYRITALHGTTAPDSMEDGAAAWTYVRDNAARFRLDPERLAAGGGSAGGLIALMVGPLSGIYPKALALFNPGVFSPSDTANLERFSTWTTRFPVMNVNMLKPGMPPMLIMHGMDDTTVPYAGLVEFSAKACELGIDSRLKSYPGAKHGFFNFNRSRAHYFLTLGETILFLDELL